MNSLKSLLFIIVLLFSGVLFSQEIRLGPKAGLNFNKVEKTELKGNLYAQGFQSGGTFEYWFNSRFSLSADLLYTSKMKGYEINETSSLSKSISPILFFLPDTVFGFSPQSLIGSASQYVNDTVYSKTRGTVKLGYIEFPVMAKFHCKGFIFSAGPYLAKLVSNKATEELTRDVPLYNALEPSADSVPFLPQLLDYIFPGIEKPKITEDINSSDVKMYDFGFITDLTYKTSGNLTFGIRYTQGLSGYRSPELKKNDYLSTISFSLGYLFNVKKTDKSNFTNP